MHHGWEWAFSHKNRQVVLTKWPLLACNGQGVRVCGGVGVGVIPGHFGRGCPSGCPSLPLLIRVSTPLPRLPILPEALTWRLADLTNLEAVSYSTNCCCAQDVIIWRLMTCPPPLLLGQGRGHFRRIPRQMSGYINECKFPPLPVVGRLWWAE